jgi:hypothetical protein
VAAMAAATLVCFAPTAVASPHAKPATSPASYGDTWTVDPGTNTLTEYAADASGAATPIATISGADTTLDGPSAIAIGPKGRMYVANALDDSILEFAPGATGDVAPVATIAGPKTGLDAPNSVLLAAGQVWVTDPDSNTVEGFSGGDNGDVLPAESIRGSKTGLDHPIALAVDGSAFPLITVLNAPMSGGGSLTQYFPDQFGNTAPIDRITGTTAHAFSSPSAIVSIGFGLLWVADGGAHSITDLISLSGGDRAPVLATLQGPATDLDTPSGMTMDAQGQLMVSDATAHTVSVFASGAHGDVAPLRTITGVGADLGSPAGIAAIGAAPGAPTDVSAVTHGSNATVRWKAPTATGGGVVGYDLTMILKFKHGREEEGFVGGSGLTLPVTTTGTTFTAHHLRLGGHYSFRVQAVNVFGSSSGVTSRSVIPVTVPSAPPAVIAIGGKDSLAVAWKKPAQDGGLPIIDYRVQYATCPLSALGCHVATRLVGPKHHRVRIGGLPSGRKYHVRVLAESKAGRGRPSKQVSATTH